MLNSWQHTCWQQLLTYYRRSRVPQALLLRGAPGVGKSQLARCFAQLLLCQQSNALMAEQFPCGICYSCCLFLSDTHPDCYFIVPNAPSNLITIEQIRDLQSFLSHTAHQGGYLCVIIDPVNAMNVYASNALLKVLEEPMAKTVILLLDHARNPLPATIISRCQVLRCVLPACAEGLLWLQSQGINDERKFWEPILWATAGSPVVALQWHRDGSWARYQELMRDLLTLSQQGQAMADPLELARVWARVAVPWLLDVLMQLINLMMRRHHQLPVMPHILPELLALPIPLYDLLEFYDILKILAQEINTYNFNQQLLLEFIFIKWLEYATC